MRVVAGFILALSLVAHPATASETPSKSADAAVALETGCEWARETLPNPAWKPFMSRIVAACEAIAEGGYLDDSETAYVKGSASNVARRFAFAVQRAANGLDDLYTRLWAEHLNRDANSAFATVGLNRTGVFLAFQHEHAFRLGERIVMLHDGMKRTAALAPAEEGVRR